MQQIISFRAQCWSVFSHVGEKLPRCKRQYEDQFTAIFSLETVQYTGLGLQLNIYTTHCCSCLPGHAAPPGCPCETGPEPQNMSMWKRQIRQDARNSLKLGTDGWIAQLEGVRLGQERWQRWDILTAVTVVENMLCICCHRCGWKKPAFVRITLT